MKHTINKIIDFFPKTPKNWEILLWTILSFVFSGDFWIFILKKGYVNSSMIEEFYTSIQFAIITLLIPLIYWLINGRLPLESIKQVLKKTSSTIYNIQSTNDVHFYSDKSNSTQNNDPKNDSPIKATDILEKYAVESSVIANNLFRRSGLYLFIGTIIAIIGVLFFSFQGFSFSEKNDTLSIFLALAPRFGILIFIELIAFFFLKQYRFAMDEHRYFEAVKRERQRAYAITSLLQQDNTQISIDKYIDACGFNREFGKLKKDESTEIIESKKISSEEIKLVEKILATIRRSN